MRFGSDALMGALLGDVNFRWVADVIYNGERVIQDLPITQPRFSDSGSSLVQSTGSCTVAYQGDFAESIAPSQVGDVLAPFGTQLSLSVMVTAGPGFTERIQMGVYLVSEAPKVQTSGIKILGAVLSRGDLIDLNLQDLFYGVQRDRFDTPGAAPSLTSVWTEYQRLTQLPVTRTVTDAAIPASVAYQEDKLQACYDLATVLDAVAYVTPDGTASMRPNAWPAPVDTVKSGDVDEDGTLISAVADLSNDDVYNAVVVRGQATDGSTIVLASAEVTDGPLRVRNDDGSVSPYRRVPYYYQSQYVTTVAQAVAYAQQQLPRVSQLRSITWSLTEKFNPLREVGDVLNVERLTGSFVCRVTDITRDNTGQMSMTAVQQ